jgi:hypothetical protein
MDRLVLVDFPALQLPIRSNEAAEILRTLGWNAFKRDLVGIARHYVGMPKTKVRPASRAPREDAPLVVSQVSFICWCFERMGVTLPRTISDIMCGQRRIQWEEIKDGDLILFTAPERKWLQIGIATRARTLIYPSLEQDAIVERDLEKMAGCKFHAMRRILPEHGDWAIFHAPSSVIDPTPANVGRLILSRIEKKPEPPKAA